MKIINIKTFNKIHKDNSNRTYISYNFTTFNNANSNFKMKIIDEYIAIKDYKAIINTILIIISLHRLVIYLNGYIIKFLYNKL